MTIPNKKLKNGFEMPVFGLGTWTMGGRETKNTTNDQTDITAIKNAIESGITHIDTAEKYAEGHAEELVGEAIQTYDRKKLCIVTKVAENHLNYKQIITCISHSLERLKTDYVDLYMIHGPSQITPMEETMSAMDEIKKKGFIKNIAVSNFTVHQMELAQSKTENKIVAGQYHLNLKIREAQKKGVINYVQEHDMMAIAWRPVQKGLFSTEHNNLMDTMCKKYGKTPNQIAINWLISQPNIVTLSKMSSKEHLRENIGAVGWNMDKEDIELLTNNFPNQQNISDAVPLWE